MAVLLVFGGWLYEGDMLAEELSEEHKTPVYLLDFYDEETSITRFDGARFQEQSGHAADFLESFGVVAPGYGPRPPPPNTAIGVVEGVTLAQAQKALPKSQGRFTANARGVLVTDDLFAPIHLWKKLKRRAFTLFFDRRDGTFSVVIRTPGQLKGECFAVGQSTVNYTAIDSVLGETTLDGILRVLDIPRHMLFPNDDSTTDA